MTGVQFSPRVNAVLDQAHVEDFPELCVAAFDQANNGSPRDERIRKILENWLREVRDEREDAAEARRVA